MKFICNILSSKTYKTVKTILLSFFLVSICILFLPTVSVEGKSNDFTNAITNETVVDDVNTMEIHRVDIEKIHPTLNKNINMKQMNGSGQTSQWLNSVLDRLNTVVERCKGKFSSLDMILIPLNLNSNQWINH